MTVWSIRARAHACAPQIAIQMKMVPAQFYSLVPITHYVLVAVGLKIKRVSVNRQLLRIGSFFTFSHLRHSEALSRSIAGASIGLLVSFTPITHITQYGVWCAVVRWHEQCWKQWLHSSHLSQHRTYARSLSLSRPLPRCVRLWYTDELFSAMLLVSRWVIFLFYSF